MVKRISILILLGILAVGCAASRRGGEPETSRFASLPDSVVLAPGFLAAYYEQIDMAMALYAFGEIGEFRDLRDSLRAGVDEICVARPSIVSHPEFVRLEDTLAQLDSLCPAGIGHSYLAADDSLALSSATWPEDEEVEDRTILSRIDDSPFPVISNDRIDFWLHYFQGPGRERFQRALYRMELYRPTIARIIDEQGLHKDLICVALIESGFDLRARSYAKAVGPWQFIAGTARIYGLRVDWWFDERRDIIASTYAATNYLKDLHGLWNDWYLALAAYNCGEYRVARAIARQKTRDFWTLDLPKQTERYVPKFLASLYIVREPQKYGFVIPDVEAVEFDQVTIKDATDLKLIADCASTTADHLADLNPCLLRWCTPPHMEIALKVPPGRGEDCARKLDAVPADQRVTWRKHRIRSGETLSGIADRYHTNVAALKSLNKIKNSHRIRAGTTLIVPIHGAYAETASSKPQYREARRSLDAATLEKYSKRFAPPANHKRVVYVVKKNDTLGEIAEVYHTSAKKIRAWNNLSYRSYIHPGQKLVLYVPESFEVAAAPSSRDQRPASNPIKRTYTVKKGDTFYSISKKFDVPLNDLLAWNGKSKRSTLYPGDVLEIRAGKSN